MSILVSTLFGGPFGLHRHWLVLHILLGSICLASDQKEASKDVCLSMLILWDHVLGSLCYCYSATGIVIVNADLIYHFSCFHLQIHFLTFDVQVAECTYTLSLFVSIVRSCFVAGTGGNVLVGEIPLLRLFNSWKESFRTNEGERAVMLTTVDMNPRILKVFLFFFYISTPFYEMMVCSEWLFRTDV